MVSASECPFCHYSLLCHIRAGKPYWYCPRCRCEVPYGLEKHPVESTSLPPTTSAATALELAKPEPLVPATPNPLLPAAGSDPLLYWLIQAVADSLDLKTVFITVTQKLGQFLGLDQVHIVQYLPERQVWLNVAEYYKNHPAGLRVTLPDWHQTILDRLQYGEIIQTKLPGAGFPKLPEQNWLLVPLLSGSDGLGQTAQFTLGYVGLVVEATAYTWPEETIQQICPIANQLAVAIRQYLLQQQIKTLLRQLQAEAVGSTNLPVTRPFPTLELPSRPLKCDSSHQLLIGYVAYYLSRGKLILSPTSNPISFTGEVYQALGYHDDFLTFWHHLRQRRDFTELYLENDIVAFKDLLNGNCHVTECARCRLPQPIPTGAMYALPACPCDRRQATETLTIIPREPGSDLWQVIVLGPLPENQTDLEAAFRLNGFAVCWVENPEMAVSHGLTVVDLVLIQASVAPTLAEIWAKTLHQYHQFQDATIVALSAELHDNLPWLERSLEIEDYILAPLAGEHLLQQLSQIDRQKATSPAELHWFPV